MCGIAAIIGPEKALASRALLSMVRSQKHRGPDDEGFEFVRLTSNEAGPVLGFGQRRLSIVDLSPLGHQPMVHPHTGDVLIFNGEIYNFQELRVRLEKAGVSFRGHSDTEVLLYGLEMWGEAFLKDLAGMYAFAFYQKATRKVLIARDPLGIKPLYIAKQNNLWMISSEVRSILASGLIAPEPDRAAVATLMAYGAVQEPLTFFKGIRAFPAGSMQWLDVLPSGQVREGPVKRFWSFPSVDRSLTASSVVERLRYEMDRSVREHLIADVPVGVFLSSGIDSTVMTGLAKKHSPQVRTFTVGFVDQPDLSESDLSRETSRALQVEHHDIQMTGGVAERLTSKWLQSLDQPSVDGLNTYVISQAVREAGVIVAISGLGGDELFGGYPSFGDVPRLARFNKTFGFMTPSLRSNLLGMIAFRQPATVRSKVREMGLCGADVHRLYLYRRRTKSDARLRALGLNSAELGLDADYLPPDLSADLDYSDDLNDPIAAVSRYESRYYMGNMLLRDSDTNSMAHSLEIRVPMLDRRVIDFAYTIPGELRLPTGRPNKHLLRAAFSEYLRPTLLGQAKRGFTLPIRRWMAGPLRPTCEAALDYVRKSGLVEPGEVTNTWNMFLANPEQPVWSSAFLLTVFGNYLASATSHAKAAAMPDLKFAAADESGPKAAHF